MNKQEVIEKIENAIPDFLLNDFQRGKETGLSYALELVEELDEPEKPVIPLYVADWLEVCKDNLALSLANSMNNIVMRTNNQPDKTIHWIAKNSETFAKAWLFGYEIKKEKLYTVELPNPNRTDVSLALGLYNDGKVAIFAVCTDGWKYEKRYKLTEAEIKKDFEWAWQFAKEVEE